MATIFRLVWMTGLFSLVVLPAGWATQSGPTSAESAPRLSSLAQPADTVSDWLKQMPRAQSFTQITGVQLSPEGQGFRLVLQANGVLAAPETSVVGNALIIEIPNAVLALPDGSEFQQANPAEGLAYLSVSASGNDRVQVAITGVDAPPETTVDLSATGLVLGVVPGALAAGTSAEEGIVVRVTGEGNEGYNPSSASSATGTETPLRDIPFSIQVVPQEVIEDRGVVELGDALESSAGVVSSGGRGTSAFGPGFLIRGFATNGNIFRDGIETFSLAPLSTNDIESIEVLRGPASVLYGQGEPGGIINLVTKAPLREPFYEASVTAGSFSTYQGALDFSGPLSESGSVRYRLNLSYDNYGSFRDFVNGNRFVASPTLTWDIGPDTSINFYGQYASNQETIDEGIVVGTNGILNIPRNRFLGEDFGEFSQNQFSLGYRLNHSFSENWSVRQATQYLQYAPKRYALLFDSFDEATGELNRLAYYAGGTYRRFFTNAEAVGRFNTGSIGHQVLIGAEYRHDAETPEFQFSNLYAPINVFNPVYTGIPYAIEPEFFRDDNVDTLGFYVQDQIELLPNLKVLAGVRYDIADQFRTTRNIGEERKEFSQRDSAFSPRFGVVYQPIEPISLYASYTRSFNPSFGASRNPDASTFRPETGRQFEVGVKADLSDQLSLNFAAFDIRRQNVRTPDPNNSRFSIQTGEVASRGIELSLAGEILPGWDMTAAYTYLDAFVSQDNSDTVGNRLANVPNNQFSLWTRYELQEGNLAGLGFGLGFLYLSDRAGNLDNTFTLPSFFRTDAALFYRRDNWRAQLNVENLFNTNYFLSSDEFLGVIPGAPLGISAKVAVEF